MESIVSRRNATRAGVILSESTSGLSDEYRHAWEIAEQWRMQHVEPTRRCFQSVLSCSHQFPDSVATYRMKRMASIRAKLRRASSHFELGALDDIGGCRLIVKDVGEVREAATLLKTSLELKDQGRGEKDYILRPRSNGYRSHHLIASIPSDSANGIAYRVEIQIRTRLEHCWATTVETAGEIYNTDYKNPDIEIRPAALDRQRLSFFAAVSDLFAAQENVPLTTAYSGDSPGSDPIGRIQNNPMTETIISDLRKVCDGVYSVSPRTSTDDTLFLLKFSADEQFLDVEAFSDDQLDSALDRYEACEKAIDDKPFNRHDTNKTEQSSESSRHFNNVVLVHATSLEQLRTAYPNYSANVQQFLDELGRSGIRP